MKTASSLEQNLKYRPEIDAIRGLAVISVMLYHFFPGFFPGGFSGVDCFFVVSGYLITQRLRESRDLDWGTVANFYRSRILRILPALTFVLLCSLAFGWFVLLKHEYKKLGLEGSIASIFGTNFFLASESTYFSPGAKFRPFLHLWSIAIEEQFYLFWPLLFLLARKIYVSARNLTFFLLIASMTYGFVQLYVFYNDVYFDTLSRAWPILTGAWIALHNFEIRIKPQFAKFYIAFFGLIIFLCNFLVTEFVHWPGVLTMIPVFATAAILVFSGRADFDSFFYRFILVQVGKWSFSLYLWHWVVLSFATIIYSGNLSWEISIVCIGISLVLSLLSYQYIENPFRKNGSPLAVVGLFVTTGLIGYMIYQKDGFPSRHPFDVNLLSERQLPPRLEGFADCSSDYATIENSLCARKEKSPIVLIGDSHAWHLHYGFVQSKDPYFLNTELLSAGSCWPTFGAESRKGCQPTINNYVDDLIQRNGTKIVLMSFWGAMVDDKKGPPSEDMKRGLMKTIDKLLSKGIRVVFLIDSVRFKGTVESCYRPPLQIRAYFLPDFPWCHGRSRSDSDRPEYMKIVNEISERYQKDSNFFVTEQNDALCGESICPIQDPATGLFLYSDDNHLSKYGSLLVASRLIGKIRTKWIDLD